MCSELIRSDLGVLILWIEAYRDNLWQCGLPHPKWSRNHFPLGPVPWPFPIQISAVHICRLRMFTWQNSSKTKELSLNSMRLFIEVGPLRFSISFFAYNISNFFPIVVHAKKHLLECQNEVNPQWININCSLLKRPHHFQACTGKLIEERRCHM